MARPATVSADLQFHEAAEIFPLLDDEGTKALADDIAEHGLQLPIEVYEGKILEGRNRYRACLMADIEPDVVAIDPPNPIAYVISMNLHRRHLTESQRAMVGARAKGYYAQRAKERQKRKPKDFVQENLPEQKGQARDEAGVAVGVSGKSVDSASKVLGAQNPALSEAVDQSVFPVSIAAQVADLSKPQQNKILKAENPKAAAKEALAPPKPPKAPHTFPISDQFNHWLDSITSQMTRLRQEHKSVRAMIRDKSWDKKQTTGIAARLRAVTDTVVKFNKEFQESCQK